MDMLFAVTPWLALLACPLIMLVMMRVMPGADCHRKPQEAQGNENMNGEVRQLQARIAQLEANRDAKEITG